jgi:squalene cyclase
MAKANYPDYDWRTEGRIKEYWNMYTLNDDLAGSVSKTLIDAHKIYKEEKYLNALTRFGDFLLLAQMPEPQPAWAQQYNYKMQPIWARKFEPAAISGNESQDVLETLMTIAEYSNIEKYRQPIPRALAYLQKSQLPDGQMARYYELKTNRPLFMTRQGEKYSLTYDDSDLPDHYGWKRTSRLKAIAEAYESGSKGATSNSGQAVSDGEIRKIIQSLDGQGRWISDYKGERLVGQPKFKMNEPYISSAVFSENVEKLSTYLGAK